MINITIKKLAEIVGATNTLPAKLSEKTFTGVSIDTRAIKHGCCFFAIKGDNFDGRDFIDKALETGAACVVAASDYPASDKPILTVTDTIEAMGKLARWYRNQLAAKVIAITGSAGKTTVREMACHVLSKHYKCHQSPKSFNNNIGLPLTLLSASDDDEIIIAELGSNAIGEIEHLTNIALPDIALVNNIFPVHLEGFGSIDAIIKEKTSIAAGLKPNGEFIINGDIPDLIKHCQTKGHTFTTFGTSPTCDIHSDTLVCSTASGSITIDDTKIDIPTAGKANLLNALAAWTACKKLGLTIEQFAKAIATFNPPAMRMQLEKLGKNVTVINDCYNANPASMANALKYLQQLKSELNRPTVFICGTMGELGDQSELLHRQIGRLAAQTNVDTILAVGQFTDSLAKEAQKESKGAIKTELFENTDMLCSKLQDLAQQDDIILVKGSRSAGLEAAVSKLKEIFC